MCLVAVGSVRASRIPHSSDVRVAGPDLLPVDDPVVAVALGPGRERGEVRAGAGLGEQLAPEVLATEQGPEPAVLLFLGAGVHEGWPRPSDADGVDRAPDALPPQFLVDHELRQWVGVEPVGRGPVRRHIARLGQLASGRVRGARRASPAPRCDGGRRRRVARGPPAERRLNATLHACLRGRGEEERRGMSNWNYADVWETVADVQPDSIAVTQGARNLTWREFDRGADGVAQFLLDLGAVQQDKVAIYLYNSPEYLQTTFGAVKVGLVPVNTNYRYGDDELSYLWENADAIAVVFHGAFTDRIEGILDRVPGVKGWLWVDDGSGPCPDWATPYEDVAKSAIERVSAPWGRSGDDLYMLYTGGTTGMPKGVMWRQDDLFARLIDSAVRHYPVDGGIEAVRTALEASPGGVTILPACPLMHGTGDFPANTMPGRGRPGLPSRIAQVRPGRSCSTPSSARR